MLECVVIADDLTGACDSAVQFAVAGLCTLVPLAPEQAGSEARVLAFSTETRDCDPATLSSRMRQVAADVRTMAPRILFKKIDSTLRGNTAAELIAALESFDCRAVVINPSFPAMGRIVESGWLRVTTDPAFAAIEVAAWLHGHGGSSCRHVHAGEIAQAIEGGARLITIDAVSADDLAQLADELLALEPVVLWAGSAGLAAALAPRLGSDTPAFPPHIRGEVLFCIGSDHPVTVEQVRRLITGRGNANARVVEVPRGSDAQTLAARLAVDRPAALFLSGGDTASLVCRALYVEAIELKREFAPGIPLGVLRGGPFDGISVLTKSGGFGAPDDLIHIADYFHA